TLTRFPTNGTTTEPELWFQVDLDLEPKGVQNTISIKASGDVVVHFGNMRHPPFDALAERHVLRRALNQMDGVHIPSGQVWYWPRFPLSVLEDPANLTKLVAVLDRLATESYGTPQARVDVEGCVEKPQEPQWRSVAKIRSALVTPNGLP
ncbi:MAG: hypothetical protein ABIZ34_08725, partial [Candidatus Limnocylindrales bacterium]